MRISDWSSDVCSSDLSRERHRLGMGAPAGLGPTATDDPAIGYDHAADIGVGGASAATAPCQRDGGGHPVGIGGRAPHQGRVGPSARSEEHTSELQSLMRISYAVFCLKKKIRSLRTLRVVCIIKRIRMFQRLIIILKYDT